MVTVPEDNAAERDSGSKDRFWIPRFWDGMNVTAWVQLLVRNRFAVRWTCIPMALIVTASSLLHPLLWAIQMVFLGRKIARTEIEHDPIFVIGHWRTGTTLVHELMSLDPRHTCPDTYACFVPNHFLLTSWLLRPCLAFLLPARRPMDGMKAGWDHPQEDEFALCNMGVRSPYLTLAFPNRPPQDREYLTLEKVSPKALDRWKQALVWFLKCLTIRSPKRIVLKSPAHTCRIKVLLELFPTARFIHLIRDPYVVFPSTCHLWKRLCRDQGLQRPKFEDLDKHVFETLNRMYEAFRRDRQLIPTSQICEVRYEDLVRDPIEQVRMIYDRLELGEFEKVLPGLREYVAGQTDYKTNRYEISEETRAEISRHWGWYIEEYGYSSEPAEV
ncbi:MAG: sulfotransferase family protein [Planctomycetota bacterium]|jgi:hypothetical protein